MRILIIATLLNVAMSPSFANTTSYCGPLANAFGPYDYRKSSSEFSNELYLVDSTHFTAEVESLEKGHTGYLGGDLDYTLRAFPNHHRALAAVAKFALRSKGPKDSGMRFSFMCYFERAMRFAPDDDGVYMVYGTYLYKRGDISGAETQLMRAVDINPDNAPANYNLGLINLHKKKYDQALAYAKKAYALDYPVQGLKNSLAAVGKWDDR